MFSGKQKQGRVEEPTHCADAGHRLCIAAQASRQLRHRLLQLLQLRADLLALRPGTRAAVSLRPCHPVVCRVLCRRAKVTMAVPGGQLNLAAAGVAELPHVPQRRCIAHSRRLVTMAMSIHNNAGTPRLRRRRRRRAPAARRPPAAGRPARLHWCGAAAPPAPSASPPPAPTGSAPARPTQECVSRRSAPRLGAAKPGPAHPFEEAALQLDGTSSATCA